MLSVCLEMSLGHQDIRKDLNTYLDVCCFTPSCVLIAIVFPLEAICVVVNSPNPDEALKIVPDLGPTYDTDGISDFRRVFFISWDNKAAKNISSFDKDCQGQSCRLADTYNLNLFQAD